MLYEGGEYGERTRENREDDEKTEECDAADDETREYNPYDRRVAREIADELKEEKEAEEEARNIAREVAEECKEEYGEDASEVKKERDVDDVFDDLEDARDDLHREYVHDMHENCPAKEAFSEESRRYYEEKEASEEVESTEGNETFSETGDGTMQVIKGESESSTSTEEASEAPSFEHSDEQADETESAENPDATTHPEQTKEEGAGHHQDELESPETEQRRHEGARALNETEDEKESASKSRERTHQQSTLDEFGEEEVSNRASEDLNHDTAGHTRESAKRKEEANESTNEHATDTEQRVPDIEAAEESESTEAEPVIEGVKEEHDAEDADESAPNYEVAGQDSPNQSLMREVEEVHEHSSNDAPESQIENISDSEIEENEADEYTLPPMLPEDLSFSIFPDSEDEMLKPILSSESLQENWESLSEEERERIRPFLRNEIVTEEELEVALERTPGVRYSADFEEDLEDAHMFLGLSEEERDAEETPRLLQRLRNLEAERRYALIVFGFVSDITDIKDTEEELLQNWTKEQLDELLSQNEDLATGKHSKTRYKNAVSWIGLMSELRSGLVEEEPVIDKLKELSKKYEVSVATIRIWLKREQMPMLIVQLERRLGLRKSPGGKVKPLVQKTAVVSRLNISGVIQNLKLIEKSSIHGLAQDLVYLVKASKSGVWFDVFTDDERLDYFRKIASSLADTMNNLVKNSARFTFSFIRSKVYLRKTIEDSFSWLQMMRDELFYMDKKTKRDLVGAAVGRLNLNNLKEFSQVVRGLTSYYAGKKVPAGGINADLQSRANYLTGESLRIILDILGMDFADVKDTISSLGRSVRGQWQIRNPLFPSGLKLKILLARMYAIIASDGHICRRTFSLSYSEENPARRSRVKSIVSGFGNVWTSFLHDSSRGDSLYFPTILGRLMHTLGMPLGDKVMQGISIPDFIMNGSPEVRAAYLQELIPEEGAVSYEVHGILKIVWGRTVVHQDPRESKRYTGIGTLRDELIQFIIDRGVYEKKRQCHRIAAGTLRDIAESGDDKDSKIASELDAIIRGVESSLLQDERRLAATFGIRTGYHLAYVRYYVRSKRVSAHWQAHTSSQADVEKWWRAAPPNDDRKSARLRAHFGEN